MTIAIAGHLAKAGSPVGSGYTVRSYVRSTGALLGSVTTDAGGLYIQPATSGVEHTVVAIDSANQYNAAVKDRVVPGAVADVLLHFDGADGSTTIADEVGNTWTVYGNAKVDTAASKFGGSSLLLDGTGDAISMASNAAVLFGSGDWTIEMFINPASLATAMELVAKRDDASYPNDFWLWRLNTTGLLQFYCKAAGVQITNVASTAAIQTGVFSHIAVVRRSGIVSLFVNGVYGQTDAGSTTAAYTDTGAAMYVGAANPALSNPYNGHIDELRIIKGFAAYTADFTPPTAPFTRIV